MRFDEQKYKIIYTAVACENTYLCHWQLTPREHHPIK